MTKVSERTHGKRIKADHESKKLSPEAIRKNKCMRSKQRNKARKAERREETEARAEQWRALSPKEQLAELDRRPGKSTKQRERILAKIEAAT